MLLEVAPAAGVALAPDRIEFHLGVEVEAGGTTLFVGDAASSPTVDVTGRDLADEPYRLLASDGRTGDTRGRLLAAAVAYAGSTPVGFAALPPIHFVAGEVLLHRMALAPRSDLVVGPGACLTWTGGRIVDPGDRDCDGQRAPPEGGDCDDLDPEVSPVAPEICGNRRDDDCDHGIDEMEDLDGDGRSQCVDCNDRNRFVFPEAPELCDAVDNDCDGQCDEGHDVDRDGLSACGTIPASGATCGTGSGVVDCLDEDPTSGPGDAERCDGQDNDCDGLCDDAPALDADDDGWTVCGTLAGEPTDVNDGVCGATSAARIDCRDGDAAVHPLAHELCNGVDDDCDGTRPTAAACYGTSGGSCGIGAAACDDTRPGGLGACLVPAGAPLVGAALCTAYAGSCAGAPDPYRCAGAAAARWIITCEVPYLHVVGDPTRPSRADLCPDVTFDLPPVSETVGCTWRIAGGMQQEHSLVGLFRAGGAPQSDLSNCTGKLAVLEHEADDELALVFNAGTARDLAVVRLEPAPVETCPSVPVGCIIGSP